MSSSMPMPCSSPRELCPGFTRVTAYQLSMAPRSCTVEKPEWGRNLAARRLWLPRAQWTTSSTDVRWSSKEKKEFDLLEGTMVENLKWPALE